MALVEAGSESTHVYSRTYLPRVGIPTMGAILKDLGYECDIWFQNIAPVKYDLLKQYDLVGIGSLSVTIREAYKLADYLKGNSVPVVMGGPHTTFMPDEALQHCDYVVLGEGEVSFPALVAALEKDEPAHDIPGIAFRGSDGEIHLTKPAAQVDFAGLPTPDFTLSPQVDKDNLPPIITTSRGCPLDCNFCSVTSMFGRKYRFKSNEQVINEIRPVLHRSVCFGDDNFCANAPRTKSLLKEMIEKDAVPLKWSGEMCVGAAEDEELLDLMGETRCKLMFVGVESIIPETLKKYGKPHDLEAIEMCVERLHKRNIGIHAMFVIGIDDPLEAVEAIVDYAIKTDMDTIQIFSMTPFPGTQAYEESRDSLLHTDWKYFSGMHVVTRPTKCSPYDLQAAIIKETKRFYSWKRVATSYRRGRGWRVKYRAGGNIIMRKWAKENADYLKRLKNGFSG